MSDILWSAPVQYVNDIPGQIVFDLVHSLVRKRWGGMRIIKVCDWLEVLLLMFLGQPNHKDEHKPSRRRLR